MLILEKKCW
jgi:CBS domain-containing protein